MSLEPRLRNLLCVYMSFPMKSSPTLTTHAPTAGWAEGLPRPRGSEPAPWAEGGLGAAPSRDHGWPEAARRGRSTGAFHRPPRWDSEVTWSGVAI